MHSGSKCEAYAIGEQQLKRMQSGAAAETDAIGEHQQLHEANTIAGRSGRNWGTSACQTGNVLGRVALYT